MFIARWHLQGLFSSIFKNLEDCREMCLLLVNQNTCPLQHCIFLVSKEIMLVLSEVNNKCTSNILD